MVKQRSGIKKIKNLAIILLLSLILLACKKEGEITPKNESAKTDIVLLHGWGTMSKEDIFMRKLYKSFEDVNPDIELHLVSVPSFESLEEKAQDMLAIGNVPHIIYAGAGSIKTIYNFMVEQESAVDLMPYLVADSDFKNTISPLILKGWTTADNKLYTVSDLLEVKGYWYNKKIFENAGITQLPKSWREFSATCQKIKVWAEEKSLNTVVMDFDAQKAAALMHAILPYSLEKTEDFPLGGSSFLQNLFLLKKIYQDNEIQMVDNIYRNPLFSFKTGHSAIYIGEVWEAREFSDNLEVGYALFPGYEGQTISQLSAGSGYLIGNWGSPEQQEASVRFVKYMLSNPVQMKILWETGRLPSNPKIDLAIIKDTKSRQYLAYQEAFWAKYKKETPETGWNPYVYKRFISQIGSYLSGEIKEKELLEFLSGSKK